MNNIMRKFSILLLIILYIFQTEEEIEPIEVYNIVLIIFGILLIIIILVYILLSSKEET